MHRRTLLATFAASAALAACGAPPAAQSGTLIVLRHAERTGEELNATGRAQAAALPAALTGIPIDAVFAKGRSRNIDTATPLAKSRGLEVQVITDVDIAQQVFKRYPGGTVVWVGNKDNLRTLWDEIRATGEPPAEYGEVFIVSMTGLRAGLIDRRRFGG